MKVFFLVLPKFTRRRPLRGVKSPHQFPGLVEQEWRQPHRVQSAAITIELWLPCSIGPRCKRPHGYGSLLGHAPKNQRGQNLQLSTIVVPLICWLKPTWQNTKKKAGGLALRSFAPFAPWCLGAEIQAASEPLTAPKLQAMPSRPGTVKPVVAWGNAPYYGYSMLQ